MLISGGHNWHDIKNYHLGEIGVFLRASVNAKRSYAEETLWLNWHGNHASPQGVKEIAKSFKVRSKEEVQKEISNNWKVLKKMFGGA